MGGGRVKTGRPHGEPTFRRVQGGRDIPLPQEIDVAPSP